MKVAKWSRGHPRSLATLGLVVLVAATLFTPNAAAEADRAGSDPEIPSPPLQRLVRDVLPDRMRGEEALDELSDAEITDVAAQNGKSVAALTEVLTEDTSAWLDDDGMLFHADPPPPGGQPGTQTIAPGPFPTSQTFRLHSRPGSNRVLYLDVDGYVVAAGSFWKAAGYTALPYDLDGDPTTWSQAEHDAIQYIYQHVAEDYAPFDVDVTTQDPGARAIGRSSADDRSYGGRVVITNSSSTDFCTPLCGGLSYVGVVDSVGAEHDSFQPSWVFHNLNYSPKILAESSSHEFGHAMGLSHDGIQQISSGYYFGHGMWAPIMGLGYNQPVTQWSKGEYVGATNTEDDFAVAASNGIVAVADETGATSSPIANLVSGRAQLIGATPGGDVDSWRYLAPCSGTFTFRADVARVGPNLNLALQISDRGGALLQADRSPPVRVDLETATGLGGSLTRGLSKGSAQTLTVLPSANGTPSTGWSNYGNVGQYSITVTSNCGPPVLLPGSYGTSEGNTGSKIFKIPVTLSAPSGEVVTVRYRPRPSAGAGLATAGVDYIPVAPGTLTFLPGETTKYVSVTVLGDTVKELPLWLGEWFFVKFHSPSANALLDVDTFSGLGVGIIGDDD